MFEFEILSISEAKTIGDGELWETARESLPNLTEDQLAIVVSLAADTCHVCHKDNGSCQCWNDE